MGRLPTEKDFSLWVWPAFYTGSLLAACVSLGRFLSGIPSSWSGAAFAFGSGAVVIAVYAVVYQVVMGRPPKGSWWR